MDEDGYEYDEGSDIDNWEDEQVFRDNQAEQDFSDLPDAEGDFRDAFELALGVRPVFSLGYLSVAEIQARTEELQAAHAAGRF